MALLFLRQISNHTFSSLSARIFFFFRQKKEFSATQCDASVAQHRLSD